MAKKRAKQAKAANINNKKSSLRYIPMIAPISERGSPGWIFINLLLVIVFLYGIYHAWYRDGYEGLSIIVLDLLVILVIKLILKFKKR